VSAAAVETVVDPRLYRVSLVCKCRNDLAYGYGGTEAEARENAFKCFRREHGRTAKPLADITEKVTEDGSRYVEVESEVRR
jgi:hypothetical protein